MCDPDLIMYTALGRESSQGYAVMMNHDLLGGGKRHVVFDCSHLLLCCFVSLHPSKKPVLHHNQTKSLLVLRCTYPSFIPVSWPKFELPVSGNACHRPNTTLLSLLTRGEVEGRCIAPPS